MQKPSTINLPAAANRQKGTNYFIRAGKSRTPDILFLGRIYHTLFSVDHWIKIQVGLSPLSEEAPVPQAVSEDFVPFSEGFADNREFHCRLPDCQNSGPGRGSLGSLGTAAKAGRSPAPCILWNEGLSFQTEKQVPQRLHKFQWALLLYIYSSSSVFLLSGNIKWDQEALEDFKSRIANEDPLGDVKMVWKILKQQRGKSQVTQGGECAPSPSPLQGEERVEPSGNPQQIQVVCSGKHRCPHLQRGHRHAQSSSAPEASLHSSTDRQGIKRCGCNQIVPSKK